MSTSVNVPSIHPSLRTPVTQHKGGSAADNEAHPIVDTFAEETGNNPERRKGGRFSFDRSTERDPSCAMFIRIREWVVAQLLTIRKFIPKGLANLCDRQPYLMMGLKKFHTTLMKFVGWTR